MESALLNPTIQYHASPEQGETLTGLVEDNNGQSVFIHSEYGKYEMLLVTTQNSTPIGCVARKGPGRIDISWEDNRVRGSGLLGLACKKANRLKIKREFDFQGQLLKVECYEVDILSVHKNTDNSVVICVAITSDGEVLNFWCDADYRKSRSLDTYVDILYGLALSRAWIARGIDSLFSLTAMDNLPSIKYQLKIGCQLQGQVLSGGVKYGVYRYSVQSRIDRAQEVARLNCIQVEF